MLVWFRGERTPMGLCCRLFHSGNGPLRVRLDPMKQKFTQFSVGELEAGARKRQGLAEARRHAQVRDRINLEVFATRICS